MSPRKLVTALALAAATAAGPGTAGAAGGPQVAVSPDGTAHIGWAEGLAAGRAWTPTGALTGAESLSGAYSQVLDVDVATDGSGAAYYVWRRGRGGATTVEGRRRAPDGSLGPILQLSSATTNAYSAAVAVDPAGNAVFVWWRTGGADQYIQARRLSAAGTLGPSIPLTPAGYQSRRPDVAMDGDGNALVVWDRHATAGDGNDHLVQSRRIRPDGTLGATQTISGAAPLIEWPQVAMDANGNALIGWIHPGGADPVAEPGGFPQVRRRSASGILGGIQDVAEPTRTGPRDLRLAMSPAGGALITWARFSGNFQEVQARFRRAAGSFGSLLTLSSTDDGRDAGFAEVAMDAEGNALVAWELHSPGSGHPADVAIIQARRRSAAGSVGPVQQVEGMYGVEQTDPALGVAPDGAATIVWEAHGNGYDRAIRGRRRQPDGTYGPVRQVDGP